MKVRNAAGFTLMEVLMAVTVFAIGILAAASMQVAAIRTNATARVISEATVVAARQQEVLLDRPYPHADLRQLPPGQPLPEVVQGNTQTTWKVRDNFPEIATKTVTITVTGMDRGLKKTVQVDRIIALGQ
ncbi:MAG: hypothetical protein COZ12_04020 [Deltaproteobacteria bacterium CG_4_10_14_3_um_filter_60_8]|nr:MAG: hypothetical protein COZ12_04020 [Deltaproteobacteria bacterium CG_4_10_14_3_um_filter_60_8]